MDQSGGENEKALDIKMGGSGGWGDRNDGNKNRLKNVVAALNEHGVFELETNGDR